MSVSGTCDVCGVAAARHGCDLCGALVCDRHVDDTTGVCVACARGRSGGGGGGTVRR